MPATAYCSLSRNPPGPWPGHYSSVQFICYFCSSFTCILYYVYLMLLAIGPNKVFLIPDRSISRPRCRSIVTMDELVNHIFHENGVKNTAFIFFLGLTPNQKYFATTQVAYITPTNIIIIPAYHSGLSGIYTENYGIMTRGKIITESLDYGNLVILWQYPVTTTFLNPHSCLFTTTCAAVNSDYVNYTWQMAARLLWCLVPQSFIRYYPEIKQISTCIMMTVSEWITFLTVMAQEHWGRAGCDCERALQNSGRGPYLIERLKEGLGCILHAVTFICSLCVVSTTADSIVDYRFCFVFKIPCVCCQMLALATSVTSVLCTMVRRRALRR